MTHQSLMVIGSCVTVCSICEGRERLVTFLFLSKGGDGCERRSRIARSFEVKGVWQTPSLCLWETQK